MPTLGPGYASSGNVYIPNFEASGRLITGFSRNVAEFALPRYVRYTKSENTTGYFLKLSFQEAARLVTQQEYVWPDGQVRPLHEDGNEQFMFQPFLTQRYDYGFRLGWQARQQAVWSIMDQHIQIHAQKLMTARTIRVLNVLTTTANWTVAGTRPDSGTATTLDADLAVDHTSTATQLAGGYLDQGTSTAPYIKKALDKIAVLINQETLGKVNQKDLHVIFNPNVARLLAESSEIHEYIKGSYWAQEEILQGLQPNNQFGLPSSVYGYSLIVENTVKITTRKIAASNYAAPTKAFVMPDQQIVVCARPGSLEGVYGAPDFSTMVIFWFNDEMTMETFDDPKNRLTEAHLVEQTADILTAPASGFLLTSATSVAS